MYMQNAVVLQSTYNKYTQDLFNFNSNGYHKSRHIRVLKSIYNFLIRLYPSTNTKMHTRMKIVKHNITHDYSHTESYQGGIRGSLLLVGGSD